MGCQVFGLRRTSRARQYRALSVCYLSSRHQLATMIHLQHNLPKCSRAFNSCCDRRPYSFSITVLTMPFWPTFKIPIYDHNLLMNTPSNTSTYAEGRPLLRVFSSCNSNSSSMESLAVTSPPKTNCWMSFLGTASAIFKKGSIKSHCIENSQDLAWSCVPKDSVNVDKGLNYKYPRFFADAITKVSTKRKVTSRTITWTPSHRVSPINFVSAQNLLRMTS